MKSIILPIFILIASYCLGQKVKRKVANFLGPENTSVSQFIKEYDTLGRKTKEILTSNHDTLIYQFEVCFFYDEQNRLEKEIDKHDDGEINTTYYYYYKNKSLYRSLTYNAAQKLISYTLFEANQQTDYIWGRDNKATRVQTQVFDSLGNNIRVYGWEVFGNGQNTKWDYEYVNEYDKNKKLIKVDTYQLNNKLTTWTKTLEYNSFGLVTREMGTLENGNPYILRRYRYDYY